MTDSNPLVEWKAEDTLIGELDGNAALFDYWVQTGQIQADQLGRYNYDTFLRLRAELHHDMQPNQARGVRFDAITPPPAITFPLIEGSITFWLHNHGILIVAGDERRKLNPSESLKLLDFLSEQRGDLDIAH